MKSLRAVVARQAIWLAILGSLAGSTGRAQDPTPEERLKILTDPESLKAKVQDKEKVRPPLEFFRSQIAPFDILPYVKANHWSTLSLEMRANHDDYSGLLNTNPVRLLGMSPGPAGRAEAPLEVRFRREARLLKEQRSRLGMQVMLPTIPRELGIELLRPESIRPDEIWQASLRTLEPHQMLILVLTKDANDAYARWSQFQAMIPIEADRGDPLALEKQRYYRLVLPLEPDKPPLSSHPLTWSPISHVFWDAMSPDVLQPSQQQAMLDWIHWGGQLILMGGAKPSFAALRESFLGPYLPADLSGTNHLLGRDDLSPLATAYPPPIALADRDDPLPIDEVEGISKSQLYLPPAPILPAANRPVFLAGLRPRPGASALPLGESADRLIGVEARVGRGRILMLALNPLDPALASWPGLDTFVRRVLLRRAEDPILTAGGWNGRQVVPSAFGTLLGPDLSWFRYLSRDLDLDRRDVADAGISPLDPASERPNSTRREFRLPEFGFRSPPVAEWLDSATLPRLSRDILERASGITIPSSMFVLKFLLGYVIVLVPVNWLVCRYILGRREWAWIMVPLLSLGFAVGVERAAAYDTGYENANDQIDVLEAYGGYPRAHLTRFNSLYTTGRNQFAISYPGDPTALALPQDNGRSLRGEDITTSYWQSLPVPTLSGFQVQPRSLSQFRSEQMVTLAGAIRLEGDGRSNRVVNATDLELREAVLVDIGGRRGADRRETYLGTIAAGATVEVRGVSPVPEAGEKPAIDIRPFLRVFRSYAEGREEDRGELRLVAWSPAVLAGQKIEPAVDRQRGVTAVVAHLRQGPPPAPDGPSFNFLARERIVPTPAPAEPASDPGGARAAPLRGMGKRNPQRSSPRINRGIPTIPLPPDARTPGPSPRQETDRR